MHHGVRSLCYKIIRQGYYWITMLKDAKKFVKACEQCKRCVSIRKQTPELLTNIITP